MATEQNYLPALKELTRCFFKLKDYPNANLYAEKVLKIDDSATEVVRIKNTCQKMLEGGSTGPELRITKGDHSTKRNTISNDWRTILWEGINLKKKGLGTTILDKSCLEQALDKFETVLLLKPGHVTALEDAISILKNLKMHDKLVARIDERIDQAGRSENVEMINAISRKFLPLKLRALMESGYFHEALDSAIELMRINKNGSTNFIRAKEQEIQILVKLGSTKEVNSLMQTAKKYFKGKKWEDADKTYDKIIELMPSNVTSRAFKASCLGALGKRKEAIECCEEAESITPHSKIAMAFVLRTKGEIYLKDGNPSEASNCLRKGIELDPNLPSIWITWGQYAQALFKLEKWEDAEESYAKWGKLRPESKAWSLYLPHPRPSFISIVIARLTTSLEARSFAFGA